MARVVACSIAQSAASSVQLSAVSQSAPPPQLRSCSKKELLKAGRQIVGFNIQFFYTHFIDRIFN